MYENMFTRNNFIDPDVEKQLNEQYQRRKAADEAAIEGARVQKNIEEELKVIIENQRTAIASLNNRIENTNSILDRLLEMTKDVFVSQEDGTAMAKEIYKILLLGDGDSLKGFLADKGADTTIQAAFLLLQIALSGASLL